MYIIVTDKTSIVVLCTDDWNEAVRTANLIRKCGGEVTIFKQTKG